MARARDLGEPDARQLVAPVPPISPTELARLRRGELDADAVAALVERTTGLGAPPAPPHGDLVPNESGWLIGPGQPRALQAGAGSKRAGIARMLWYPLYLGALEFLHWHWYFALLIALAPLIVMTGAAASPLAKLKRQLERAGQVASLAGAADGTLVCVYGTIVPQPTVRTLFRGIPAVFFRNRIGSADETRGSVAIRSSAACLVVTSRPLVLATASRCAASFVTSSLPSSGRFAKFPRDQSWEPATIRHCWCAGLLVGEGSADCRTRDTLLACADVWSRRLCSPR